MVCGIGCLADQDKFFANNPFDVKANDEHAVDFAFRLFRLFSVSVSLDFPCTAHAFFTERLSKSFSGLRLTLFNIYTNFNAVPLSDPSRNRIRPDTRLQIKGRKKSTRSPSCVKICTLTPTIWYYYRLPLHHAATTAVQTAAPVL
jgi:hypothetical protein